MKYHRKYEIIITHLVNLFHQITAHSTHQHTSAHFFFQCAMHNLPCTSSFNHSYKIISLLMQYNARYFQLRSIEKKTKKNRNSLQRKVIHKHMVQKLLRKNDISKLKRIGSMVDNNFHLLSCVQNFNLQFLYIYISLSIIF